MRSEDCRAGCPHSGGTFPGMEQRRGESEFHEHVSPGRVRPFARRNGRQFLCDLKTVALVALILAGLFLGWNSAAVKVNFTNMFHLGAFDPSLGVTAASFYAI